MHRPVLTTAPTTAPVSLAEAKLHLRVDHSTDDTLISALLDAAVAHLDGWTGILGMCLEEQTWRQDFDAFAQVLFLPLRPVSAIDSITYRNTSGQVATVSSSDYALKTDAGGRSFVRFLDDYSFPSDLYQTAAVSVTYTAGYARDDENASTVPMAIRHAILLLVAHWYANSEAVSERGMSEVPMGVRHLLAPYRHQQV